METDPKTERGKKPRKPAAKKKTRSEIHAGHRERLRDEYIAGGIESFPDHKVLELLLFYCVPRKDTNELAHNILDKFGTIHALFEASPKTIARTCRLSMNTAVLISLILPLSKRYMMSKWDKDKTISNSAVACAYARGLFVGETNEVFFMICLDTKNRIIHPVEIARGTIDKAPIYPRAIVDNALKHSAASVILAHNHPGGSTTPSMSDIKVTNIISRILENIEVRVADHIIVGAEDELSFASKKICDLR